MIFESFPMRDGSIVLRMDFTRSDDETPKDPGAALIHSARDTTSSRYPGAHFEKTIATYTRRLVQCPHCKGYRLDFNEPHAPQTVGDGVLRDCIGRLWKGGVLL
jgi:hypothetical protein